MSVGLSGQSTCPRTPSVCPFLNAQRSFSAVSWWHPPTCRVPLARNGLRTPLRRILPPSHDHNPSVQATPRTLALPTGPLSQTAWRLAEENIILNLGLDPWSTGGPNHVKPAVPPMNRWSNSWSVHWASGGPNRGPNGALVRPWDLRKSLIPMDRRFDQPTGGLTFKPAVQPTRLYRYDRCAY